MPSKYKPTRDRKQHKTPKPQRHNGEQSSAAPEVDPNAEVMVPLTKEQKEERRRKELRAELKEGQPKMSGKKLKRFNKYIENKLKKEERSELMVKLAENRIDTSLLRSTRELGAGRETKRELVRRALMEERAGINLVESRNVLYEERRVRGPEELEAVTGVVVGEMPAERVEQRDEKSIPKVIVGAGLKRPLEADENGMPIVKRVKKSRQVQKEHLMNKIEITEQEMSEQSESPETGDDASGMEDTDSEEERDGGEDEYGGRGEEMEGEEEGEEGEEEGGMPSTKSSGGGPLGVRDSDGPDEGESEGSSDGDEGGGGEGRDIKPVGRLKQGQSDGANAFKAWALAQRKEVLNDGEPEYSMPNLLALKPKAIEIPRKKEPGALPPLEGADVKKAFFVTVERPIKTQTARLALPVVAEEQRIMETIKANDCVVICGETGSGKTTQVPQFLYEAGYGSPNTPTPGLIGVTQPRRVAAVSMASRVGDELGAGGKQKVAYQIRFEGTSNPKTAIKFMTDGVLLRELSEDFLLQKYSAIIIDEAHERSINTDILIGVMSRVLKLRKELAQKNENTKAKPLALKLIIMSATLRVSDFVENKRLFSLPPPLLRVEARQHPVSVHFSKRTASDYGEEAFKKVCKIHRRLPPGGILVFLTGQNEITGLLKRLRKTFPFEKGGKRGFGKDTLAPRVQILASEAVVETETVELGDLSRPEPYESDGDSISGEDDDNLGEEMSKTDVESPLHVLPLYSLLPTKEQLRVFGEAPEGSRLCVLATNVAETSLTIPGIRYVVDCGRSKERNYDKTTGVQSFDIGWISKASASQRAGRSGRTGPGHCYRLYSSAVYERDFHEFSEPEILRMPIEGVVLQMKSMNIDTIANFPFPTPPDRQSLQKAERLLGYLGALDSGGGLSKLGRTMSVFPLSPRFSKILIIGQQHGCLPYIIAVVAALSVGEVFIPEHQFGTNEGNDNDDSGPPDTETMIEETLRANRRKEYFRAQRSFSGLDHTSDALKLLSVVCAFEYETRPAEFCEHNFIRLKAMQETHKLRQQITNIVRANCPGAMDNFRARLTPPSAVQIKALRQIIAAGFIDQVAIRADLLPNSTFKLGQTSIKKVTDVPYMSLFASATFQQSLCPDAIQDTAVYIHPSSVLASQSSYPEYLIYLELKKSSSLTGKIRMKPLTPIGGAHLSVLAKGTQLITYSKPLDHIPPKVLPDSMGKRRESWVIPRIGGAIGKSELGWALPARKVVQKKEGNTWVVE